MNGLGNAGRGTVYLATGAEARQPLVQISRSHLFLHHPELPQHVVTDQPEAFDESRASFCVQTDVLASSTVSPAAAPAATITAVPPADGFASRQYKTQLNRLSPFRDTLYLDTDTVVIGRLDGLWKCLERAPVGLAYDFNRTLGKAIEVHAKLGHHEPEEISQTLRTCSGSIPYFNSGVIVWRACAEANRLFSAWHEEWRRFQGRDQLALIRAIARTQTPIAALPLRYNWPVTRYFQPHELRNIRILHFWQKPKLDFLRMHGFIE